MKFNLFTRPLARRPLGCLSGLSAAFVVAVAVSAAPAPVPALKDVFKNDFYIGAALNESQFYETDQTEAALVKTHFSSISPENDLKWEQIHPTPGHFDFTDADRYVAFGESNKMFIIGHTLVWHSQTPSWVFEGENGQPLTREVLLARMHEHISTVVGRYRGRIKSWDVLNEVIDEDGSLRKTPWLRIIGEDYLVKAFQFAHEADPQAELYYNDYALENSGKRAGAIAMIKKLRAAGVQLSGVGLQGHYKLQIPTPQEVDDTIMDFANLGLKVSFSELDVDMLPGARNSLNADVGTRMEAEKRLNPYPKELPLAEQQKLAARYAELFAVFLKHRGEIKRVTLWGVTDADSWLNDWPVVGRTSYPLLFDRAGKPKLAFMSVVAAAQKNPASALNRSSGTSTMASLADTSASTR